MGYRIVPKLDSYEPRKGLEGPFRYPSGRVLYYDPKEGQYWDPRSDFYLSNSEAAEVQACLFEKLKGNGFGMD
jgi:hypothetical protein